jgi:hypothetical protein
MAGGPALCTPDLQMASNDDAIIIGKIIESLRSLIADLDVEIGEQGGSYSKSLDSSQRILKDAIERLTSEIQQKSS